MIKAVVTHYVGFSDKLTSLISKILIGYVEKNRLKSPLFMCHTDVTLKITKKKTSKKYLSYPTKFIFV